MAYGNPRCRSFISCLTPSPCPLSLLPPIHVPSRDQKRGAARRRAAPDCVALSAASICFGLFLRPLLALPLPLDGLQFRRNLAPFRSEGHTSELPSLMRIPYAGFCLE